MMSDSDTMRLNSTVGTINFINMIAYMYYTNSIDRRAAWTQISGGLAVLVALRAYILFENPKLLFFRIRLIHTAAVLLPFFHLV